MLHSANLRLVAAFDHRHIFIDPDPDPAASHAERRRLHTQPGSSWADYDPNLISDGGGVWPRSAKNVCCPSLHRNCCPSIGRPSPPISSYRPCCARGRPALEQGYRHVREVPSRISCRCGRSRQRQRARQRRTITRASHRRGRQPGPHPTGTGGLRSAWRQGQRRLHRQCCRRGHLRPRGQPENRA